MIRLLDILADYTIAENMRCETCAGAGEVLLHGEETGYEPIECEDCLGSGMNQLGLIMHNILRPPAEGYGPVALRDALHEYQARRQFIGPPEPVGPVGVGEIPY